MSIYVTPPRTGFDIFTPTSRPLFETPTTILSRIASSGLPSTPTPHAQAQRQAYYYHHPGSHISDHLEYRAPPLGFEVTPKPRSGRTKRSKPQAQVVPSQGQRSMPRLLQQTAGRPGRWVEFDSPQGPGLIWIAEDGYAGSQMVPSEQGYYPVHLEQRHPSWLDVPTTTNSRPQYKDQSTQTDPITIEDLYAQVVAHQAQQEMTESTTQDSSKWTGGSGAEVEGLVGWSDDSAPWLDDPGIEVDMPAASSGSTYIFPPPVEEEAQISDAPISSGTSRDENPTMTMIPNFDSLDSAILEMAILEGWADIDFGLIGSGVDTEQATETIDPTRIDWMMGQGSSHIGFCSPVQMQVDGEPHILPHVPEATTAATGSPRHSWSDPSVDSLLHTLGVHPQHVCNLTPVVSEAQASTPMLTPCDANSESLSPPPPPLDDDAAERSSSARRYKQPPGAGWQLPRGLSDSNTSLAENVKTNKRQRRTTQVKVKEKAPPKVKKEKTAKRATKTK